MVWCNKVGAMKILAVDDDPEILEILGAFLAHAGYEDFATAGSAAEALSLVEQTREPFECFLLDIQMPGMSGTELMKRLRSFPQYSDVPVLKLTAMSDQENLSKSFAGGALDYIVKPFEFFEVETRLHAAELRLATLRNRKTNPEANVSEIEKTFMQWVERSTKAVGDAPAGLITKMAFENYLYQLKSKHPENLNVLAVQLKNLDALYARLGQDGFSYYVQQIVAGLSRVFEKEGCLYSYYGGGSFSVQTPYFTSAQATGLRDKVHNVVARVDEAFIQIDFVQTDLAFGHSSHLGDAPSMMPIEMLETAISQAKAA